MYAERISGVKSSTIRDILKLTSRQGMISFAGGLPAPELFPIKDITAAVEKVLSKHGSSALQYSTTEGLIPLREKIAVKLDPDSNYLNTDNILIAQDHSKGLILYQNSFLTRMTLFLQKPRAISVRFSHSSFFRQMS